MMVREMCPVGASMVEKAGHIKEYLWVHLEELEPKLSLIHI